MIVVTNRRLLDKQLRDNIKEFSEVKNIVAHAYSSAELKTSLESGKQIIITSIQKFPFIVDGIADLSDKRDLQSLLMKPIAVKAGQQPTK